MTETDFDVLPDDGFREQLAAPTTFAAVTEKPKDTSGDEFCHIIMGSDTTTYCGRGEGGPTTCKPYAGEAICPSCGLATCPTCAVQSALNDRLEYS